MITRSTWVLCAAAAFWGCGGGNPSSDGSMPPAVCATNADCDDGQFCNGAETCDPTAVDVSPDGCLAGVSPCSDGESCNESTDSCSDCAVEADADGDGARAIACGGNDCDDNDDNAYPGNTEVCDTEGHDEDCDPATFGIRDGDGDDEPDAACCNGDNCGSDCDDTRSSVGPDATEACNGRDDDCDGSVDEGVTVDLYQDMDGDGFGNPDVAMNGCPDSIEGFVSMGTDCDDTAGSINPAATDVCDPDEVDEDCSGTPNDPPGGCACTSGQTRDCVADGICAAGTESCIDGMFGGCSIEPEPFEICDGEDDDCNGVIDDGLRRTCWDDGDGDGYAATGAPSSQQCMTPSGGCPTGYTHRDPAVDDVDCNDSDDDQAPGQTEVCNGIDDDCNGVADEMLRVPCYVDEDNDTYAAATAMEVQACRDLTRMSVAFCPLGYTNRAPSSVATTDCNDAAGTGFDFHPGAPELCDSQDNDCNGMVDDGARVTCWTDSDDDGYPNAGATSSMQCRDGTRPDRGDCPRFFTFRDPAVVADQDCDDGDPSRYPGAVELCDAIDQDCDGTAADAMMVTCYADADDDGYAAAGAGPEMVCPDASRPAVMNCPEDYTDLEPTGSNIDCAPNDPSRNPDVTEMCDEPTFVDSNCNGDADEGTTTCWRDVDEDGYATYMTTNTRRICGSICPAGWTLREPNTYANADCNDGSAANHVIVRCYPDTDRDSYRASGSTQSTRCYTTGQGYGNCPNGYTTRTSPTDCCPSDPNARPNQTSYYSTRNACSSWDYNCNGSAEKRFTTNWGSQVCSGGSASACEGDVTRGWQSSSDPACGVAASMVDCAFLDGLPPPGPSTVCQQITPTVTQLCR